MNALVRVGVSAAKSMPTLLARARTLASNVFTTTPAVATAAGKRLGMISAVPAKILAGMKDNKLMSALVLMELGTAGYDLLSEMAQEDKEIADMVARYGVTDDPVPESAPVDAATLRDEMQCITDAANAVGGLTSLHNLRRALGLTADHYKYYDTMRDMSRVIR